MESELLYLARRAAFHRRLASQALSTEARSAHQAFVRAYLDRSEERKGQLQPRQKTTPATVETIVAEPAARCAERLLASAPLAETRVLVG